MRNIPKILAGASATAVLIIGLALSPAVYAGIGSKGEMPGKKECGAAVKAGTNRVLIGGCIATDRKGGNCAACHYVKGIEKTRVQAGNIGPALAAIKVRFSREQVRARVYDATKINPATSMPPFGRHKILSSKEIDLVVDWLMTL
ncbi:MAG: sulfur oxidation c-type cytochrome SoxX [Acidiferrobacterales bacterium]